MDITSIVTSVISGVLGITAVGAFVAKYVSMAARYAHIAKGAIVILSDTVDSLADGKLSEEELATLIKDVAGIKAEFNTAQPPTSAPLK